MSDNVSDDVKPMIFGASSINMESSPLPATPGTRVSSSKGMGYGMFQPMGMPGYSPPGFSPQVSPFSPMAAPMMNMHPNMVLMQYYQPVPLNASQAPQTEAPTATGQTSGSGKPSQKEGSASVPSKKAKRTRVGEGEEPKTRPMQNKFWLAEHDDVLIPYLAEQVKKGHKFDKSFKRVAFESAAVYVNSLCNTGFTPENVINHMRSLKSRYLETASVFQKITSAKWDEEKQMITVDKADYDNIKEENSKLRELINTPLKHFENTRIIFRSGEYATGEFRKTVYDSFGVGGDGTGDKSDDSVEVLAAGDKSDDPVDLASDDDQLLFSSKKQSQPGNGSKEKLEKDKQPTRKRKHREIDNVILASVKEMAEAIRHARIEHWSKELSRLIYRHAKYPALVLDEAYDFFYDDEKRARRFIAKPLAAQDRMIKEFIALSGIEIEIEEGNKEANLGDGLGEDVVDI